MFNRSANEQSWMIAPREEALAALDVVRAWTDEAEVKLHDLGRDRAPAAEGPVLGNSAASGRHRPPAQQISAAGIVCGLAHQAGQVILQIGGNRLIESGPLRSRFTKKRRRISGPARNHNPKVASSSLASATT
jgi:hypothetical protein